MLLFTTIKKKTTLNASTKQVTKARKATAGKADQLYKSAYEGFEFVLSDHLMLADALYNWGFGLLNQAKSKDNQQAITLYEEAINKYRFCLTIEPYYLGAAVEAGVAYMDLARIKAVAADNDLYSQAKACFEQAGHIQKGSGAFNLACLYSVANNHEACLVALKEAKDFAHLPDEADILSDPDMKHVLKKPWFIKFMDSIKLEKIAEAKALEDRKKAKMRAKLKVADGATDLSNEDNQTTETSDNTTESGD
jgi:tetratricopeptide (TPR) repeat protein